MCAIRWMLKTNQFFILHKLPNDFSFFTNARLIMFNIYEAQVVRGGKAGGGGGGAQNESFIAFIVS